MKGLSRVSKRLEAEVSALAQRLNKTPVAVIEEAVDEYGARHDLEPVTRASNRVADVIDMRPDAGLAGVAERTLRRTESSPDALMGRFSGFRLVVALERDRRSQRGR